MGSHFKKHKFVEEKITGRVKKI